MGHRFIHFSLSLVFLLSACTEGRIRKYQDALDPLVGSGKKIKVDHLLGAPTRCRHRGEISESCEYRTSFARNYAIPVTSRKIEGWGPDLSPYEYFDVLVLSYDGFGVLQTWEPMVILKD